MGLYLCVFDESDDELDGVEIGSYADFGDFRDAVVEHVEGDIEGSRCPVLMHHSDSDGSWSPTESATLLSELTLISDKFQQLPPIPMSGWKVEVARAFGLQPGNLYECYFDVDGEPLIGRLLGLTRTSIARNLPILFQ